MSAERYGGTIATIDADTAAELLGVNVFTLYRWVREGRVPAIRLGRSVRFRVAALEAWLLEQEQKAMHGA